MLFVVIEQVLRPQQDVLLGLEKLTEKPLYHSSFADNLRPPDSSYDLSRTTQSAVNTGGTPARGAAPLLATSSGVGTGGIGTFR